MTTCRYVARTLPRVVPGRHGEDCRGSETCAGCLPCTEPHCRICGIAHVAGTCAECVAETRAAIHEIARMCNALPEEVEHRGVEGEAMMLLGPSADPEARSHLEQSVQSGRLSRDAIEASHVRGCDDPRCTGCAGEVHPDFVLGGWDAVWREALDHDEPAGRFDLAVAVDYLDRQLTYMADYAWLPFENFARDVRRCASHLEAVLHDGEQRDEGAPCMNCGATLLRAWDLAGAGEDGWRCPRCKQTSTEQQYRFAVAHLHRSEATELTDRDMEIRTGVKAGTVRSWASHGLVARRQDAGRTVYLVADVITEATKRGLMSA